MENSSPRFFFFFLFFFVISFVTLILNQNKILDNQEEILYILDEFEDQQNSEYNYVNIASLIPTYYNSSKSKTQLTKDIHKEIDYLNTNINKEIKKTKDKIEKIIKEN